MFNPEEETERDWDSELREDVKGEVESKYGKVSEIFVEKESAVSLFMRCPWFIRALKHGRCRERSTFDLTTCNRQLKLLPGFTVAGCMSSSSSLAGPLCE
jgi:hypothetical protein